jgi:preprotein translocase subunit SecD
MNIFFARREKEIFWAAFIILIVALLFIFSKPLSKFIWLPSFFVERNFLYGLDVAGGTILTYQAQIENINRPKEEVLAEAKDLIERRINFLGVAEVNVSYTQSGKIIVEIPGFTDPEKAVQEIGATPLLEFYIPVDATGTIFQKSELTGKYIKKAEVQFNQKTYEPEVVVYFDEEGEKIFAELTEKYLGKPIAIYLDNKEISRPVVREVIKDGVAVISGRFNLEEAKTLARRLNEGALPVPLALEGKSLLHPKLGSKFINFAIRGGALGFFLVSLFLIFIYRLPGFLSILSLFFFIIYNLALYKILGVTISLAGIAGLILSAGIAVDANVLVFARFKEERKKNLPLKDLIYNSYQNAWPSIRDSNIATLISSFILYNFSVSFVKGFALTLFLGILINLFLALFVTRSILLVSVGILEKNRKLLP